MTDFFYVQITEKGDCECGFKISKQYEREVRAGLMKWEDMSEK